VIGSALDKAQGSCLGGYGPRKPRFLSGVRRHFKRQSGGIGSRHIGKIGSWSAAVCLRNQSFTGCQDSEHLLKTRSNRILESLFLYASLFLDERTLKDRPRIKAGVIRPPETPPVFILFLNWKVNQ